VSTRVEGAEPPVILITAKATLAAGAACLMLTVTEESANLWRYNLSEKNNSRLAYGKTITTDYMAALRRAAEICADGYQPGAIERGLLESFAQDPPRPRCQGQRQVRQKSGLPRQMIGKSGRSR
jgi:hypothetical protein